MLRVPSSIALGDWLGEGIYFWEQNPERTWEFAEEQRNRGKIARPSVIGAFIHLGRCFDLARSECTAALGGAHAALVTRLDRIGAPLPVNRPGRGGGDDLLLRELDCAVLNFHLRDIDAAHGHSSAYYQTVRGVLVRGLRRSGSPRGTLQTLGAHTARAGTGGFNASIRCPTQATEVEHRFRGSNPAAVPAGHTTVILLP